MVLQSNGKIVLAGSMQTGDTFNHRFALTRLTSNGAYDTTFGTGGKTIGTRSAVQAHAVTIGPDGKIFAGGNDVEGTASFTVTRYTGDTPIATPYAALPFATGQTIQAERFDRGGQNISYYDTTLANDGLAYRYTPVDIERTTDTGGGFDVTNFQKGEWLQYSLNVAKTASYTFSARVATPSTGAKLQVLIDGVSAGYLTIPSTGGPQTWRTLSLTSKITLKAGRHAVRIVGNRAGSSGTVANLNWIKFA